MSINIKISKYEAESLCAILGWVALGTKGRPNAISRIYEQIEQKLMDEGFDPDRLLTLHNLVEIKEEDAVGLENSYALRFIEERKYSNKTNKTNIPKVDVKTIQAAQIEAAKLQSLIKQKVIDEEQLSFDFSKKKTSEPIDVFDISFEDS